MDYICDLFEFCHYYKEFLLVKGDIKDYSD